MSVAGPEVDAIRLLSLDELLDLALIDSFPASDPTALGLSRGSSHETEQRRHAVHRMSLIPVGSAHSPVEPSTTNRPA